LGLGGMLKSWLDYRRSMRKQSDEVAMNLVTQLTKRIETVEASAAQERALCDANLSVLRHRVNKQVAAAIACAVTGIAAALAIGIIWDYTHDPAFAGGKPFEHDYYVWMPAGPVHTLAEGVKDFNIPLGFLLDPLSCVMLFVVTFVGFLIHLYSVGYMSHEEGFQRFFTYLNLFMGAMLLLILGNSYAVMFVGWEGVGLCSYLLIGFYYKEEFPPYAGRKAFVVNRIGDFAFVLGLGALVATFGSLKYTEVFAGVRANTALIINDARVAGELAVLLAG